MRHDAIYWLWRSTMRPDAKSHKCRINRVRDFNGRHPHDALSTRMTDVSWYHDNDARGDQSVDSIVAIEPSCQYPTRKKTGRNIGFSLVRDAGSHVYLLSACSYTCNAICTMAATEQESSMRLYPPHHQRVVKKRRIGADWSPSTSCNRADQPRAASIVLTFERVVRLLAFEKNVRGARYAVIINRKQQV